MITLVNVSKRFGRKVVLHNASVAFPSQGSTALLGRNGAGKSTVLRLIAGTSLQDRGQILRSGTVSWPVGFAGAMHPDLTGAENLRFLCKLYQIDYYYAFRLCAEISALGRSLFDPVGQYSNGMRARLAFAMSMTVPFDTYLLDEITAVGDQAFRDRCTYYLQQRLQNAGAIIVSHSIPTLRALCQSGCVLDQGKLHFYPHVDGAIGHYNRLMASA